MYMNAPKAYVFKDIVLGQIYKREQAPTGQPLEKKWKRTTLGLIFFLHNKDLGALAATYLVVILVAFVLLLSAIPYVTSGDYVKTVLPLVLGTTIFGTFIELLRRIYDTAVKRLGIVDLFVSEMLSIARVLVAMNLLATLYASMTGLVARRSTNRLSR